MIASKRDQKAVVKTDPLIDAEQLLTNPNRVCRKRRPGRSTRWSRLRSEVNSELNFPPKLRGARSRLYRRRFLQVNTRWKKEPLYCPRNERGENSDENDCNY